jgi:hypothetical protein
MEDIFGAPDHSAKAILTTYQQVNDSQPKKTFGAEIERHNRALALELHQLKQKYDVLKQKLADRENHLARLEEDFHHAIRQLSQSGPSCR